MSSFIVSVRLAAAETIISVLGVAAKVLAERERERMLDKRMRLWILLDIEIFPVRVVVNRLENFSSLLSKTRENNMIGFKVDQVFFTGFTR